MTLIALGLLLAMVGLLGTMVIEIAQADYQTKRQSSRGEGQTALGDDSSYGFSSQPVRHRRQNVECEEDCFRVSAVFTPFLLLGVYHECGQVEKDIWTTFILPSIKKGGVCTWISSIWLSVRYFFCSPAGSSRRWNDCKGGKAMNAMYVLGGILSLGLLVYLMVALLKPEWF